MTYSEPPAPRGACYYAGAAGIGLLAGFLSGMFGVGGGVVIVPLLVLLLGMQQRRAAGTSLAATMPASAIGTVGYAATGDVAWIPALILAGAAVVGAQLGTWLLPRVPVRVLQVMFLGFMVVVIVNLFIAVPTREAGLDLTPWVVVGLVALGLITGILSGLLGIGGGVIVVPSLMLLFHAGDLIARGTSLMMVLPTAISGTIGNARRKNLDVRTALTIGAGACVTVFLGIQVATLVDPATGNTIFAIFLALVAIQLAVRSFRRPAR